jgi:hypothetical protein
MINLKSHIMCLGLIPSHFVLFLKDDCLLPPSSMEWKIHKRANLILCDTPEKKVNEEFEVIVEYEDDSIPLDEM